MAATLSPFAPVGVSEFTGRRKRRKERRRDRREDRRDDRRDRRRK